MVRWHNLAPLNHHTIMMGNQAGGAAGQGGALGRVEGRKAFIPGAWPGLVGLVRSVGVKAPLVAVHRAQGHAFRHADEAGAMVMVFSSCRSSRTMATPGFPFTYTLVRQKFRCACRHGREDRLVAFADMRDAARARGVEALRMHHQYSEGSRKVVTLRSASVMIQSVLSPQPLQGCAGSSG